MHPALQPLLHALNADIYNNSLKRKRAASKPGSGRISQMTKWKQGVLERERLKKASIDSDDDVQEIISVVNPEAINPVHIEGKKVFCYDVGDLIVVKNIAEDPSEGCEWMVNSKGEFTAQDVQMFIQLRKNEINQRYRRKNH